MGTPPSPSTMGFLGGQKEDILKLSKGSKTLQMTSAGSEEMFEGAFADIVSSVQRKGEQGAPLA